MGMFGIDDNEAKVTVITGTNRDYTQVKKYDISIKIWLPEIVRNSLNEMCKYIDTNLSDIIRQTLFLYLYGRYDLMSLVEKGEHDFTLNANIMFSLSEPTKTKYINRTSELGKNMYGIKVSISSKMKEDLLILAEKLGLTLSVFIREILISNLFGHTYLHEREELLALYVEI